MSEYSVRECLHEISFRVKWKILILVSGQFLITVYIIQPEMKLVTGVISLRSFWQKWNLVSGEKISCKHYLKWYKMKGNICTCVNKNDWLLLNGPRISSRSRNEIHFIQFIVVIKVFKNLVVSASNTRDMGLKLYKIWVQKPDTWFVTVATSTSQHLMIINNWTFQQSQIYLWETFSIFSVFYGALQTLQLHLVPFQCLIIILNDSRFSEDFIWYDKLFQILGPKTLKLLLPKVTWLCTGRLKFNIYFFE